MNEPKPSVMGTIIEALPNTFFRVKLENGTETVVYLSGKMRMNRIRVLVGDKVKIELEPYGGKGRVIQRI